MNGAPQRKLREEDLLFWAEKVLGQAEPLVLGDFRDGILLLRILQRVLGGEPRVAKTIGFAMHDPAGSLQERMENLALVDAVLREHGSDGLRLSAMLTGDDSLDLEQVERGNVGAIASLLMVLYRFYCTKSTTDVRRVKVRAKNAKARPASLNTTEASATAAIAAIGPAAVQERAHGARGGAWDGWQGETVIGLLPVKETLSIVSQADGAGAYKEKMAVLTAHACWLSALILSREEEVAACVGGPSVVDALRASLQGASGGVWDEDAGFRRMCRTGFVYCVSLTILAGDGLGMQVGGGGNDEAGSKLRLESVCEALKGRGLRLRVEAAQLLEPLSSVSASAHVAVLDALAVLYVQSLVGIHNIERVITRKWHALLTASTRSAAEARRAGFTPDKPLDLEDALAMWLTCTLVQADVAATLAADDPGAPSTSPGESGSARVFAEALRRRVLGDPKRPVRVEELQMDLSDGRALLLLISHLVPEHLAAVLTRLQGADVCASETGPGELEAMLDERVCAGPCRNLKDKCRNVALGLHVCSRIMFLPVRSPHAPAGAQAHSPGHEFVQSHETGAALPLLLQTADVVLHPSSMRHVITLWLVVLLVNLENLLQPPPTPSAGAEDSQGRVSGGERIVVLNRTFPSPGNATALPGASDESAQFDARASSPSEALGLASFSDAILASTAGGTQLNLRAVGVETSLLPHTVANDVSSGATGEIEEPSAATSNVLESPANLKKCVSEVLVLSSSEPSPANGRADAQAFDGMVKYLDEVVAAASPHGVGGGEAALRPCINLSQRPDSASPAPSPVPVPSWTYQRVGGSDIAAEADAIANSDGGAGCGHSALAVVQDWTLGGEVLQTRASGARATQTPGVGRRPCLELEVDAERGREEDEEEEDRSGQADVTIDAATPHARKASPVPYADGPDRHLYLQNFIFEAAAESPSRASLASLSARQSTSSSARQSKAGAEGILNADSESRFNVDAENKSPGLAASRAASASTQRSSSGIRLPPSDQHYHALGQQSMKATRGRPATAPSRAVAVVGANIKQSHRDRLGSKSVDTLWTEPLPNAPSGIGDSCGQAPRSGTTLATVSSRASISLSASGADIDGVGSDADGAHESVSPSAFEARPKLRQGRLQSVSFSLDVGLRDRTVDSESVQRAGWRSLDGLPGRPHFASLVVHATVSNEEEGSKDIDSEKADAMQQDDFENVADVREVFGAFDEGTGHGQLETQWLEVGKIEDVVAEIVEEVGSGSGEEEWYEEDVFGEAVGEAGLVVEKEDANDSLSDGDGMGGLSTTAGSSIFEGSRLGLNGASDIVGEDSDDSVSSLDAPAMGSHVQFDRAQERASRHLMDRGDDALDKRGDQVASSALASRARSGVRAKTGADRDVFKAMDGGRYGRVGVGARYDRPVTAPAIAPTLIHGTGSSCVGAASSPHQRRASAASARPHKLRMEFESAQREIEESRLRKERENAENRRRFGQEALRLLNGGVGQDIFGSDESAAGRGRLDETRQRFASGQGIPSPTVYSPAKGRYISLEERGGAVGEILVLDSTHGTNVGAGDGVRASSLADGSYLGQDDEQAEGAEEAAMASCDGDGQALSPTAKLNAKHQLLQMEVLAMREREQERQRERHQARRRDEECDRLSSADGSLQREVEARNRHHEHTDDRHKGMNAGRRTQGENRTFDSAECDASAEASAAVSETGGGNAAGRWCGAALTGFGGIEAEVSSLSEATNWRQNTQQLLSDIDDGEHGVTGTGDAARRAGVQGIPSAIPSSRPELKDPLQSFEGRDGDEVDRVRTAVGGKVKDAWGDVSASGEREWDRMMAAGVNDVRSPSQRVHGHKVQEVAVVASPGVVFGGETGSGVRRGGVHFVDEGGRGGKAAGDWLAWSGGNAAGIKMGLGGVAMELDVGDGGAADEDKRMQRYMALRRKKEEDLAQETRKRRDADVGGQGGDLHARMKEVLDSRHANRLNPAGASAVRHSNRKIIINAIKHVCLVSVVDAKKREAVIEAINAHRDVNNFVIVLVREPVLKFKGLYALDLETQSCQLLPGTGSLSLPKTLTLELVREFLKYDSGAKTFKSIDSKSFSISSDAVVLLPQKPASHVSSRLY